MILRAQNLYLDPGSDNVNGRQEFGPAQSGRVNESHHCAPLYHSISDQHHTHNASMHAILSSSCRAQRGEQNDTKFVETFQDITKKFKTCLLALISQELNTLVVSYTCAQYGPKGIDLNVLDFLRYNSHAAFLPRIDNFG